jgi:hypothetical protein
MMVIVTTLLIGVASWLHVLCKSEIFFSDNYGAFMFRALRGWFVDAQKLYVWFGLILFLFTAMLMTFVNTRLHLINKTSYLPALCYVLLTGGAGEIHMFNPAVIATLLLVSAFVILSVSLDNERLSYSFFTVPAMISVAAFFYQYMYVYMMVVWLVIALLRPGYWREWVFSILGFALPLFIAFSWFFLVDDDYTRMGAFFEEIFTLQRVTPSLSISTIIFISSCTIMVITIFIHTAQDIKSKKVIFRNRYYVLFLIAVVTVCMIFIVPDILPQAWYFLAFPMSFFLSNYLANTRSIRWGTIVLTLLFTGVLVVQAVLLFSA